MELNTSTPPTAAFTPVLACDNPFATLDREYLMALTERFGSSRKPDLSEEAADEAVTH